MSKVNSFRSVSCILRTLSWRKYGSKIGRLYWRWSGTLSLWTMTEVAVAVTHDLKKEENPWNGCNRGMSSAAKSSTSGPLSSFNTSHLVSERLKQRRKDSNGVSVLLLDQPMVISGGRMSNRSVRRSHRSYFNTNLFSDGHILDSQFPTSLGRSSSQFLSNLPFGSYIGLASKPLKKRRPNTHGLAMSSRSSFRAGRSFKTDNSRPSSHRTERCSTRGCH